MEGGKEATKSESPSPPQGILKVVNNQPEKKILF